MSRTRLLTALAVAAFAAAPALAGDFSSGAKTTICHRTGKKPVQGLFRGHLITVSNNAVATHRREHGDVVVRPEWLSRFSDGRSCAVDAAGKLYDDQGRPVPDLPPPSGGVG